MDDLKEIQQLIQAGALHEAAERIQSLHVSQQDNPELLSAKATLALMQGDLQGASQLLKLGLDLYPDNVDLVYNMAVYHEKAGNYAAAFEWYTRAYVLTDDTLLRAEINLQIRSMRYLLAGRCPRVLIGSVVSSTPEILREFLVSLGATSTDGLDVEYRLVDATDDPICHRLLKTFAQNVDHCAILKPKALTVESLADSQPWSTHAALKNKLVSMALDEAFDYLFLVDSNLILHPLTLRQLVATEKPVVCSIAWGKRHEQSACLPHVWLTDGDKLYRSRPGEHLTVIDTILRAACFVQQLKHPGTYEVGGVSRCILIDRASLQRGVSFAAIANLSLPKEDQHFSVRAHVTGLPLYVDTHFPVHPLDTSADQQDASRFKAAIASGSYPVQQSITLVYTNLSGSNTFALYRFLPEELRKEYDITLLKFAPSRGEYFERLANSDAVVITEGNYLLDKTAFNPRQLVVDLWHGLPLKTMGYADPNERFKDRIPRRWASVDYVVSYSNLFTELMEQCIRIGKAKYRVAGAPRNDFLFHSHGLDMLKRITGKDLGTGRRLFYLPTYRQVQYASGQRRYDSDNAWQYLFGIPGFDIERFASFLDREDLHLVLKLHPAEEHLFQNRFHDRSRIHILTNSLLERMRCDLYEVLNAADLLITDYSSVYFDYLLLDRPIVFVPADIQSYRDRRGFLLNPYEDWTPGPKAYSQAELEREVLQALSDPSYYSTERRRIRELCHAYPDGKSSQRVWSLIHESLRVQ